MIINRYLTREILLTLLAVLAVLLLIFMGRYFARYLAWAAEGFIASSIVIDMLVLRTLSAMNVMLPFALYLSVLIAFGRLYKDSEMTALAASGVSTTKVLRPVLGLAAIFMLVVGALSFYISPWAQETALQLQEQTESKAQVEGLAAGQFAQLKSDNNPVFYAEGLTEDRQQMSNVFVQIRDEEEIIIYSADSGYQTTDPQTGQRFFVLLNGKRYQIRPGDNRVNIQVYRKSAFRVDEKDIVLKKRGKREISTAQLIQDFQIEDIAELQWRLSLPLSALLLPLLAVLLSRTSPRQGRFGKLFVAILIFIFYNNALGISRSWVEAGQVSPLLGMWWVHCILVLLIAFLYSRQSGWRWKKQHRQLLAAR